MTVLTKKELRERRRTLEKLHIEADYSAVVKRARSVTVGTAFGGTMEIMMRKADGDIVWAILQPVEVIELIHQLAAGVGCHINLQPRKDFASWRNWKHSEEELLHFRGVNNGHGVGHPPHAKSDGDEKYQSSLPPPEQQPGLQPALMARSESNEQTVATEKPVKRSRAKRAAASA